MSNLKIGPVDITSGTAKLDAYGLQVGVNQFIANLDGSVTLAGNSTVSSTSWNISTGSSHCTMSLGSSAGFYKQLVFRTGTQSRWSVFTNNDPETGGNLGSSLLIARYSDAGNYIDSPILIGRSDGAVVVSTSLIVPTLDVIANDNRAANSTFVKNCLLNISDRAAEDSSSAAANTRFVQNAISAANGTKVSTFNGRSGAVTLNAADVINALGYVPANPAEVVTGIRVASDTGVSGRGPTWSAPRTGIVDFWGFHNGAFFRPIETSGSAISGSCIHPHSLISMNDGSTKFACDIRPGDVLQGNNKVLGLMNSVLSDRNWIEINNKAVITSDHLVKVATGWSVKSRDQYTSHYQTKTFACKTINGMKDLSGDFGDADTFTILSTGLTLSTGEEITSLKEFYGAPHHPVISIYTEQESFFADGIEVASMGKEVEEV